MTLPLSPEAGRAQAVEIERMKGTLAISTCNIPRTRTCARLLKRKLKADQPEKRCHGLENTLLKAIHGLLD